MEPTLPKPKKPWTRAQKLAVWTGIGVPIFIAVLSLFRSGEKPAAQTVTQTVTVTQPPTSQVVPDPSKPSPHTKPLPPPSIEQHGTGNAAAGRIDQSGNCNINQIGGSGNQATVNCATEWHFSEAQRNKWAAFVVTLPEQCAEIVVAGDIPDGQSSIFAREMFDILDQHHRVNRLGHLLAGEFGTGVTVEVHDEGDISVPTAKLILSGMQNAEIPVAGLSVNPTIRNHEIHLIVAYKPEART